MPDDFPIENPVFERHAADIMNYQVTRGSFIPNIQS
jgi:hypothetical protein